MKIAFISLNREQLPDPVVPLGVLSVMAHTPPSCETALWDLCFKERPLEFIADSIKAFSPDLFAVGIRNIHDNQYADSEKNLSYYDSVVDHIRKLSSSPIIAGGSGFSMSPSDFMERFGFDFGIAGEAEGLFPQFINAYQSDDYEGVDCEYGFYRKGAAAVDKKRDFLDLDLLNSPRYDLWDPEYIRATGTANVQTKRGCALKCTYCSYPLLEGRKVRLREPKRVVDDMLKIKNSSSELNHFFIVDSVFNIPTKHATAVCDEMIKNKVDIPWTCYVNPIGFTKELATKMAAAGCVGLECGSDSGCEDVLAKLQKGFKTKEIRNLSVICKEVGIKDCHTFIVGTEDETIEEVDKTFKFIKELDPYCVIVMIWNDSHSFVNKRHEEKRKAFRLEIEQRLKAFQNEFPRLVAPNLGINFGERLFRVLRKTEANGPLWQSIDKIERYIFVLNKI